MPEAVYFDKYDAGGAYHWAECDRRYVNWRRYNPALDARYDVTTRAVAELSLRGSLLDVGCGDGMLMARVAPLMDRVVGVDSEPAAIGCARQQLRGLLNCETVQTACYDLPFDDGAFDVVTSADVIEHLTEPNTHLKEISRVLKRTGALVLTTPHWRPDRKWDARHEKEYRADELSALLGQYFGDVTMRFFWPTVWSRAYETRLGWRVLKLAGVSGFNPFVRTGRSPERFGQILAVCRLSPAARRTTLG